MKEKFFNFISIVFIISSIIYFGNRTYNAYKNSKENIQGKYITDRLINTISKYELNNPLNKIDNEYMYIGKVNNNYLKYQGYLWRIIKINSDNEIVALLDETITYLPKNNILEWLHGNKYNKEFEINYNYLTNTKLCIDTFNDIKKSSCNEINNNYVIGTLSIEDYIKVGGNNSYLNNGTNYWTSNKYDNNNSWFIGEDGLVSYDDNKKKHGVRPLITIRDNTEFIDGNGTKDNPYIIEKRNINTLKDTLQGEYISYNNIVWRIMYTNDNKITIFSEDYIKVNNNYLEYYFDDINNIVSNDNKLIYYLNHTYLNTLPNKEYLTLGTVYIGQYNKNNNNYNEAYYNKIQEYVSIPSINQPYIYNLNNIHLINPSNIDDLTKYSINNNTLYEDLITTKRYIRPILYLKNNITINDGNGTNENPYILGGINEV